MAATRRTLVRTALTIAATVAIGACSSTRHVATSETSTTLGSLSSSTLVATSAPTTSVDTTAVATTLQATTTTIGAETTTTANANETTLPPTTGAATSAPATTAVPACPGPTSLPGGITIGQQIVGNVDGDLVDDTVTAYVATDDTSHVFLQRGVGAGSDIALPLGYSNVVSISFENFDAALGAAVAPPLVVLATGGGAEGSVTATFVSTDTSPGACLHQWQLDAAPFTFPISLLGPYTGLFCDHAAGHVYYVLRTATPDGAGNVVVTSRQINHSGTIVTLAPLGDQTIPDDGSVAHKYGDIQGCDHAPLFP